MKSWVEQEGFPVVRVDGEQNVMRLEQNRFFADPGQKKSDQTWEIPLVVKYEDDEGVKEHRVLFNQRSGQIELPASGAVRWMYPNADAGGFFRLSFSDSQLQALLDKGLDHLTPAEKIGLLEDQWELVRTGQSPIGRFMDVLSRFSGERDPMVVTQLCDRLTYLDRFVIQPDDRDRLAGFTRSSLRP
ncbi:MAG: ERAP1-like C-terminal domain-containing protein, partial [Armatimonadetes bacterium]|nr:ERAP1-like C-terminal domain-containing protein [Armatimonadota bacterium]